jgi:hypothetical protein
MLFRRVWRVKQHEAWVENFDRIDSIALFVTAKGGAAR